LKIFCKRIRDRNEENGDERMLYMQENEDLKKYKATAKYNLELPDNPGIRWKKGRKYDLLYNHGAYELSSENGTTFYTDSAFESLKKMFNIE
jgi:hypothetical protein